MTTEEVQRIAQQILDRRGYLVIGVSEELQPGARMDDVTVPSGSPLGAELRVLRETDAADHIEQCRLVAALCGWPCIPEPAPRYYQAKAE